MPNQTTHQNAALMEALNKVTPEMTAAAEGIEDLYRRATPNTWTAVYRAMLKIAIANIVSPTAQAEEAELPPLPEPFGFLYRGNYWSTKPLEHDKHALHAYATHQMRSYALAARADLVKQVAGLKKDAERYQWLRTTDEIPFNIMRIGMAGEKLDAAIDAAMKEPTK